MDYITFVAVVVIAIVAFCYLKPLIRLKYFAKIIEKQNDFSDLAKKCPKLSGLCSDYDKSLSIEKDERKRTLHHAKDFFNSSELARVMNINLKHINSAPGILSGLGVLGTFVGLTFSVATFDSTDSAAIMASIKTLLGGMGTAFTTSLIGMTLSVIYIMLQKRFYNMYDNAIAAFVRRLDQKYHISADEILISEKKKTNREILTRLAAIEKSKEINQKLNAIQEALIIQDEDGAIVTASAMMLNLYEESEKQSQALESFTTDLSNELNASLGRTMDSSIVPLIQKLGNSHDVMNVKIEELSHNIQSPATDFVTTAIGELRTSMQAMTDEFRDSVSTHTINQLENLTNNLVKSGELLNTLPTAMQQMADKVAANFNDVKGIISDLQAAILKQQNEMLENSRSANNTLAEQMRNNFSDMTNLQNNALMDAQNQLEQSVNKTTAQIAKTTADLAQQMDSSMHSMMIQLEKAVTVLNEQQNSLSDTHTRSTREIERLLEGFAQSIVNMHNANSKSSEMLASIKIAGNNLNESTDKLNALTSSLNSASREIINQQKETTAKFAEIQHDNQSIINQIMTALTDSQNMIDSYVANFETIKVGMKEVFNGINDGLKDYSATLRESTGGALAEYSEAMTKSTDALKNIAAALEDSAEELSDSIDKFKRLR